MFAMEKKQINRRPVVIGLITALALLICAPAQGQPSKDRASHRSSEQGMRSSPSSAGSSPSPAPQVRMPPSGGMSSAPSAGPHPSAAPPSGGSVQINRAPAPQMRESITRGGPSLDMGRPTPSFSTPPAPRSFNSAGPVNNETIVRRQTPSSNITFRSAPSDLSVAGATTDRIQARRFDTRSDAPKTVSPGATNRSGGVIFDSLSLHRGDTSPTPRSRDRADAPVRPSDSPAPGNRASALPGKTRPDATSKTWSSRSITNSVTPAPEVKAREPSAPLRERIIQRRSEAPIYTAGRLPNTEQVRVAGTEVRQSREFDSRLREYGSRGLRTDARDRGFARERSSVIYHDRPDLISRGPRYSYIYRDSHDRIYSRLIWPGYSYPVYYGYGSSWSIRWVYPYYQRRYVWVSLGGWWPYAYDYPYLRYYWYGWHPYVWYGYYPVPREVEASPDNYYYTYNYYYPDNGYAPAAQTSPDVLPYGIDNETYARIQALIQRQRAGEPPVAQDSDKQFEAGVESFGAGQYAEATAAFADAMRLSPEDKILPYAYAQALFAAGRYAEAAAVLRVALHQVTPEQEGVFYPRGLYLNDDVLFGQIEQLLNQTENYEMDGDLKLLLGYQLMGIGEVEYARHPLEQASADMTNAEAAQALLKLLDKMDRVAQTAPAGNGAPVQIAPGAAPTNSTPTGATPGQPQNQPDSAAKSSLLDKVKALDSGANQPQADVDQRIENKVNLDAVPPAKPKMEEPNAVSGSSLDLRTGRGTYSGAPRIIEAALIPSPKSLSASTDERLMALVAASVLIGGGVCLRRAGRLTS